VKTNNNTLKLLEDTDKIKQNDWRL